MNKYIICLITIKINAIKVLNNYFFLILDFHIYYTINIRLILEIMSRCKNNGKFPSTNRLNIGDFLKLLSRPFANLNATIDLISPQRCVWVLMQLKGHRTRIEVSPESFHPAYI